MRLKRAGLLVALLVAGNAHASAAQEFRRLYSAYLDSRQNLGCPVSATGLPFFTGITGLDSFLSGNVTWGRNPWAADQVNRPLINASNAMLAAQIQGQMLLDPTLRAYIYSNAFGALFIAGMLDARILARANPGSIGTYQLPPGVTLREIAQAAYNSTIEYLTRAVQEGTEHDSDLAVARNQLRIFAAFLSGESERGRIYLEANDDRAWIEGSNVYIAGMLTFLRDADVVVMPNGQLATRLTVETMRQILFALEESRRRMFDPNYRGDGTPLVDSINDYTIYPPATRIDRPIVVSRFGECMSGCQMMGASVIMIPRDARGSIGELLGISSNPAYINPGLLRQQGQFDQVALESDGIGPGPESVFGCD